MVKSRKSKKTNSSINGFPIVGIGASAGGLEAFKQMLETLPIDTGMAFIFVQHLEPSHQSLAPAILSRTTKMSVHEVEDGMRILPNHVYLSPPNFSMAVLNGVLSLLPRIATHGQHLTVDFFFQSLALDQKGRAVGVVLSGRASDGTQGLKAIKVAGGLTIAQDPKSAKYDSMPKSAIALGIVDLILAPEEIARALGRISKHPYIAAACAATHQPQTEPDDSDCDSNEVEENNKDWPEAALRKIFALLRKNTQVDFSNYKHTTVKRRIHRRMMVRRAESLDAYAKVLQEHNAEIEALYADILINVTEFFRDPNSFKAFTEQVFPTLIKNRADGNPIRIWVPGCSTGEEAYSIAILLLETLGDVAGKAPIQIFATDISESTIQKARAGIYPEGIERTVNKDRLNRFFEKVEGGYKVNKAVRDLCLFSKHDVTSDPPFSKLDLVSCRNVLIYFSVILQKRIMPTFHYALKPGGFLFLGRSDSPGWGSKLFSVVEKAHNIYSRIDIPTRATFQFPEKKYSVMVDAPLKKPSEQVMAGIDFQRDADRIALIKYAPPSVIVNADLEILQFRGRTVPYLEPASGVPSNNLLKMARHELLDGLRHAIKAATKNNTQARQEGLVFETDGKRRTVNIEVVPANPLAPVKQRNFVIFFEEVSLAPVLVPPKGSLRGKQSSKNRPDKKILENQSQRINQLEQLVSASKQYQQSMAESFDAAQEELTAANEELQSTNEEFQSTNEELETAKEELQSTNEELITVNDELKIRNVDLGVLSSDLNNLLSSIEIPIIIVGNDHRIRRFTPKAESVFNLIPSDVGRPIGDIKSIFDMDLDALILKVTQSLILHEKEIKDRQGRWMRLQIRPYKTIDNRIDGAVITVMDIEALKRQAEESKKARDYLASVSETVRIPLAILDDQLRLQSANRAFWEHFKLSEQIAGKDFFATLEIDADSLQKMKKLLTETLRVNKSVKNVEMDCEFLHIGNRTLLISAGLIHWIGEMPQEPQAILLSFDDITERKLLEKELAHRLEKEKEARTDAERANLTKDEFIATLSHELRTPITSILAWSQLIQKQNFDPDKLKHGIKMIEQSAKMQGQLIDDLLDVTRIRSGKLSISFTEVDPSESVSLSIAAVRLFAESKQVVIESEIKLQSEKVWGDHDRIQQVVWNLLTNAVKFSSQGGTVRVCVEAIEENGGRFVMIKIIDAGKGVSPEFLPKLFERFSQADSSSIRVHGGLGLGLAIVRDLVQLQGGTVRAESEGIGKGATFTVQLPVKSETVGLASELLQTESPAENKTEKKNQKDAQPVDLTGLRVMIVEDESSTREALSEVLNSFGAKTLPCSTVTEALAALEKFKPDVLVSDISMPGEDGYSLIRKIRDLGPERCGDVPSLALTAYATAGDVKRTLSAGFDSHMAKPFDSLRLGHAVAKLAKRSKGERL